MCGIAGAACPDGIAPGEPAEMAARLRHRGPDGEGAILLCREGTFAAPTGDPGEGAIAGLAHTRLSILDLSEQAAQPMVSAGGSLALVYNGEVYNYCELRAELAALGQAFGSSGDTEVVLAAYSQWGTACFERFVGMWALAILDAGSRELVLCRDRFGIKPLFRHRSGRTVRFASEIKALLALDAVAAQPDEDLLRRWLRGDPVDAARECFVAGIEQVEPGHALIVSLDDGSTRSLRYWEIPHAVRHRGLADSAAELRDRLRDSVRVHLRSDVPVGISVSGGIDSSGIAGLAAGEPGGAYARRGFGYVPAEPELSERSHMEAVAAQTGIAMSFVEPGRERLDALLESLVRQHDEPFASTSLAAQWLVFDAAREAGMRVMLGGQGADEVIGGYLYLLPRIAAGHLCGLRLGALARLARDHRRRFGIPVLPLRAAAGFALGSIRLTARASELPASRWTVDALLREQTISRLPELLRYEDRNSMAHSIEGRVPFLDHRLVELCFSLPEQLRVRRAETKTVLREALRDVIPEQVRERRDKIGFRAEPAATWDFARRRRESLLAARSPVEERLVPAAALGRRLDSRDRSSTAEFALWRHICARMWLRYLLEPGRPLI